MLLCLFEFPSFPVQFCLLLFAVIARPGRGPAVRPARSSAVTVSHNRSQPRLSWRPTGAMVTLLSVLTLVLHRSQQRWSSRPLSLSSPGCTFSCCSVLPVRFSFCSSTVVDCLRYVRLSTRAAAHVLCGCFTLSPVRVSVLLCLRSSPARPPHTWFRVSVRVNGSVRLALLPDRSPLRSSLLLCVWLRPRPVSACSRSTSRIDLLFVRPPAVD